MDLTTLKSSLTDDEPPSALPPLVEALWHEAKGDWDRAHKIAQDISSAEGSWVHAYLHRAEGDLGNAGYWYRRAGKPRCEAPLKQEWDEIATALL